MHSLCAIHGRLTSAIGEVKNNIDALPVMRFQQNLYYLFVAYRARIHQPGVSVSFLNVHVKIGLQCKKLEK